MWNEAASWFYGILNCYCLNVVRDLHFYGQKRLSEDCTLGLMVN